MNNLTEMEAVQRDRWTEDKVRGLDTQDIVDWIHSLEDALEAKDAENERLRAALEVFANDTDDCVSPGMKAKAKEALGEDDE